MLAMLVFVVYIKNLLQYLMMMRVGKMPILPQTAGAGLVLVW